MVDSHARQGVGYFFALTFAISWSAALPALGVHAGVLSGPPERYMPLMGLSAVGPTLAAVLAARREGSVRALFVRFTRWRVAPWWYLVALGLQGACLTGGLLLYACVSSTTFDTWVYYPDNTQRIVGMVVISFAEEVGWRGFALPRLQRRYGALAASIMLGVLWALWHVPMFVLANVPLSLMPIFVAFFVAGSVFFTWLFNHTRGSLLLAYLAHVGAHLNNAHAALPSSVTPLLIHTSAYVLLAAVLLLHDQTLGSASESSV